MNRTARNRIGLLARLARRGRSSSGQGLVEFALIVPLVMLLLVGIYEFANAWRAFQVVTDAGREVARVMVADSTLKTQSAVDSVVVGALQRAGLNGTASVSVYNCPTAVCSPRGVKGQPDTVKITYSHPLALLDRIMGVPAVQLKTTFVMRNQYSSP